MLCLLQSQPHVDMTLPIITWRPEVIKLAVHQCFVIYNLSFWNHISMSANKANKLLWIVRKSFCALDITRFTLLCEAIVRRSHEYTATISNPNKKDYIYDVEMIQRMATTLLHNISHLSYPDWLPTPRLPTLAYRRMNGDMMDTFMIVSNIYDSRFTNFRSKSNLSITREHKLKLFVQHANFYIRKLISSEQEKKWFFEELCHI